MRGSDEDSVQLKAPDGDRGHGDGPGQVSLGEDADRLLIGEQADEFAAENEVASGILISALIFVSIKKKK
jgi:hypothetical protein